MGDLLADGVEMLKDILRDHVSQEVSYSNGVVTLSGVKATVGRTLWTMTDPDSNRFGQVVETRDFIIDTSLLASGMTPIVPAFGHVITQDAESYKVVQGPDGHVYRSGDDPTTYRIHTTRV